MLHDQNCHNNLVLGDLNSHFSRNSAFTSTVQDFFDEIDFRISWENPDATIGHLIQNVDFTFTFKQDSNEAIPPTVPQFI